MRSKMGPAPNPPRDGDKKQARKRIEVDIRNGWLAHPNTMPCTDCGRVWKPGDYRHTYDHYLGYGAQHHRDVQPVCVQCHSDRDNPLAKKTHCVRGHEFTPENTYVTKRGFRNCMECRKLWDKNRWPSRKIARLVAQFNARNEGKLAA